MIVPTAWYSILGGAPDDEPVIRSKHVEQEKNGGIKIIYKELCISFVIYTLQYDARYIQRQINSYQLTI